MHFLKKKIPKTFETRNGGVVTLHCHLNKRLTSGKRLFYFGEKALLLRGSQKQGAKQRHRQRPRG